mmetsp:Transcript_29076/g.66881  ORF Transcript_29076/g.66881 Transcript_29076/m.66881 type:complete len:309 (-) Transcript_29076:1025-1951(-)
MFLRQCFVGSSAQHCSMSNSPHSAPLQSSVQALGFSVIPVGQSMEVQTSWPAVKGKATDCAISFAACAILLSLSVDATTTATSRNCSFLSPFASSLAKSALMTESSTAPMSLPLSKSANVTGTVVSSDLSAFRPLNACLAPAMSTSMNFTIAGMPGCSLSSAFAAASASSCASILPSPLASPALNTASSSSLDRSNLAWSKPWDSSSTESFWSSFLSRTNMISLTPSNASGFGLGSCFMNSKVKGNDRCFSAAESTRVKSLPSFLRSTDTGVLPYKSPLKPFLLVSLTSARTLVVETISCGISVIAWQ